MQCLGIQAISSLYVSEAYAKKICILHNCSDKRLRLHARPCLRLRLMRTQSRSIEDSLKPVTANQLILTSEHFSLYMALVVRVFDVSAPCNGCVPGSNHQPGSDAGNVPLFLWIWTHHSVGMYV